MNRFRYLLDTSTCIEFLHGNSKVLAHLVDNDEFCCLSTITIAELFNGAYNAPQKYFLKELNSVRRFADMYESLTLSGAEEVYSKTKKQLQKCGLAVDDFDIIIAAIAIRHEVSVVTSNTKHFERIEGLKFEDWTK